MDMQAKLEAWKEKKRKREEEEAAKKSQPSTFKRTAAPATSKLRAPGVQARVAGTTKSVTAVKPSPTMIGSRTKIPTRAVAAARTRADGRQTNFRPTRTTASYTSAAAGSTSTDTAMVPTHGTRSNDSPQSKRDSLDSASTSSPLSSHESSEAGESSNVPTFSGDRIGGPLRILQKKSLSNEALLDMSHDSPPRLPRRVSLGDPPSSAAKEPKEDRRASYEMTPTKRRSSLSSGPLRVLANRPESDSDDDDKLPAMPEERRTSTLSTLRTRTSTSRLSTSRSFRNSLEPVDKTSHKLTRDDFKNTDKKLGFGKFGYVYLAKQKTMSEKEIALKVLTKSNMDEVGIRSLKMEVEIQSRLKHPHILRLYRYFHEDTLAYLVLEYAPHGTLQKQLEDQPGGYFPEERASAFIHQVVTALQYLHARHVIHRDIKPENLLLGLHDEVKVADFGLAIHVPPPNTRRRHFCGTPEYMSPEIILEQDYSCEVDIWSLGIVAYELLVGRTPFRGEDVFKNIQMWFEQKMQAPELLVPGLAECSHISENAKAFVQGLLSPAPSRWSLEEALQHDWLAAFR
ncbi:Aste57867_16817 [Aphanomyces stellatus]|uniref:Aurora kinase n=1 Tax=Aphanomyces stellatus TaxID=120398 RepID=A0A485L6N1_9STRA|nr:hypothetical protein As57867_016759 [Aphanomyces stellatus]VFT93582.1 Aste57867_16817 [Aphanomyces stellatus]